MSDFIPEDVVVDILSRLPTKSLIRFRSVSKLWDSLITSPNFIDSHFNRSLTSKNSYDNLPLVIVRQCVPTPYIRLEHYKLFIDTGEEGNTFDEYLEIPFPLKSRRLHYHYLMGYVKGLFCVFEHDNYFLWNPSIRKSISLPKPGITKKTHGSLVDRLGFGYDSRNNDYKLVRIVILCGSNASEEVPIVQLYSLNAGSWKVNHGSGDSFPLGFRITYSQNFTACLEGTLHWVAEARRNSNEKLVLSFDLFDEEFKTIPLPNDLAGAKLDISTSVFGGFLSLLCEDNFDRANKSCSVWIMKEYGVVDSWYKYVKIDLTGGIRGVIGIRKNGHILLEGNSGMHWELSSYDLCNEEIKKLGIHGALGHFHVDTYEENLILLNKTDVPVSRRGGSRKRKNSIQSRMEAHTLATEVKRLMEMVEGKIKVVREMVEKVGIQKGAEIRAKLQSYSPQIPPKDVQGNEEINSTRLIASSQDSVANDYDVAEKFSQDGVLGRGESIKRKHLNGGTSADQGICYEDCLRNEDLEILRKVKAECIANLKKLSEMDQILQSINLKVPPVPGM